MTGDGSQALRRGQPRGGRCSYARTLTNCLNTRSQKARTCRGMCSEIMKHFMDIAQLTKQTLLCPSGNTLKG